MKYKLIIDKNAEEEITIEASTFLYYSDSQNCVAVVQRTAFQNTFCVRRGLGRSLNKQKDHPCRESGFG